MLSIRCFAEPYEKYVVLNAKKVNAGSLEHSNNSIRTRLLIPNVFRINKNELDARKCGCHAREVEPLDISRAMLVSSTR